MKPAVDLVESSSDVEIDRYSRLRALLAWILLDWRIFRSHLIISIVPESPLESGSTCSR
jgi:hypothetical protein